MGDEKSPSFSFYPKDFLSSERVQLMTMTERGIYITLLSVSWLENGLPVDVKRLAAICKVPLKQFARIWPHNLAGCFVLAPSGRQVNARLEEERERQARYRDRQRENGSKGGRGKSQSPDKPTALSGDVSPGLARGMRTENREPAGLLILEKEGEPEFDGQRAFQQLVAAYVPSRISTAQRTQSAFIDEIFADGQPNATFALMLANLENHKDSHEWKVKGMVPDLYKWLAEGRWRRTMAAAAPAAERLTKSTAVTFQGAADFLKQGA